MLTLLLLTLLAQAPHQGVPGAEQHGLGEEEITGEATVLITDRKIPFAPQFDPLSAVQDHLLPDSYVFDETLSRTADSLSIPHHFIRSSYLRVPVEKDFIYGDIMVFLPVFERRVSTWTLDISNSLGETVRRVTRSGHPPATITWDGRTDNGEPIATGDVYSFTFNAFDAQGNQTRLPGIPRRVDAMVFRADKEATVSLAAELLFVHGTSRLHEAAARRLDEAANIIREAPRREVIIYVYSEFERLSTERCNVMRAEIERRVVLPSGALSVAPRFTPGLKPKFSKVEILVR
ncbi:MAG: FlgD immunoglobulin-like domain containing protein [bacterium]